MARDSGVDPGSIGYENGRRHKMRRLALSRSVGAISVAPSEQAVISGLVYSRLPSAPWCNLQHRQLEPRFRRDSTMLGPCPCPAPNTIESTTRGGPGGNAWSGVVCFPAGSPATSNARCEWVSGTWTIPSGVLSGVAEFGGGCSVWIGIDGTLPSSPLLQAGVAGIGGIAPYAVWEWVPDSSIIMDTFPVCYGDTVSVIIMIVHPGGSFTGAEGASIRAAVAADPSTLQLGIISMANLTQGVATSFFVGTSDPGYVLPGASAEWIVEQLSGMALPSYGQAIFADSGCGFLSTGGLRVPPVGALGDGGLSVVESFAGAEAVELKAANCQNLQILGPSGMAISEGTLLFELSPPAYVRCSALFR
jgi:Peptidase A4 family